MKKHILGIAVFSLIVGVSVFVYCVFAFENVKTDCFPQLQNKIVESVVYNEVGGGGSGGERKIIKQAVLDLKTKQMNWELYEDRNKQKPVLIHFFSADKNGERFIKTVYAPTADEFVSSYDWLDRLGKYENLYVIAEYENVDPNRYSKSSQVKPMPLEMPAFEINKAVPILIYSGNRDYSADKFFSK
jgi:hypothetical protein